jgi:hypothetical protein
MAIKRRMRYDNSREETTTFIGFEVLTVVAKKGSILWDITPCSPLKIN